MESKGQFDRVALSQAVGNILDQTIAPQDLSSLSGGSYGETFTLHGRNRYVVKGRRLGWTRGLTIEAEAELCTALRAAGLNVPEVLGTGVIDDRSFIIVRYIDGRIADFETEGDIRRLQMFMNTLYSICTRDACFSQVLQKREVRKRAWWYINFTLERWPNSRLLKRAQELNKVFIDWRTTPCILHGDVHPGNFLVTLDGKICGIDWELARLGEREYDVARSNIRAIWLKSLERKEPQYLNPKVLLEEYDVPSYLYFEALTCLEFCCNTIWSKEAPPSFIERDKNDRICSVLSCLVDALCDRFDYALDELDVLRMAKSCASLQD